MKTMFILLSRLLSQLELEMQTWLLKMAAEFAHRKDQLVFLINNYDMIISVVAVSICGLSCKCEYQW